MYFYQQHHEAEPSVMTPVAKPPKLFHAKNTEAQTKANGVGTVKSEVELDQEDFENLLQARVRSVVLFLGFNPKNKGFAFAIDGSISAYKNPLLLDALSKTFYPLIAKQCSSTGCRIERCVRHELDNCYKQRLLKNMNHLFNMQLWDVENRMSNGVFFSLIVQFLETELGSYKRVRHEIMHHRVFCHYPF